MYVITGATGNTGKRIAEILLEAGKPVTVISRQEENLQELVAKGAKPAIGDLSDTEFLTRTFTGATAVYAMIPPNFQAENFRAYQNKIGHALASAIKAAHVPHVVVLSSFGTHLTEGTGVLLGMVDFEKTLSAIPDVHVLNLRPGFFFENLYGNVSIIKEAGIMGGFPIDGDVKMPMIHTKDIAEVAAKKLLNLDFQGQSHHYLGGERDLSFNEVTSVLGKAIGRENLPWVQFSYDQAQAGMMQMGMSESLANAYVDFSKRTNDGSILSDYQRTPETTTPTSIEQFAREFAYVFNLEKEKVA